MYFHMAGASLPFLLSLLYLPVSLGILLWVYLSPGINPLRRLLGISADIGMISLGVMLANGEEAFLFEALYLWVITGNGFRFGIRYLLYATVLSVFCFVLIMIYSPYWHDHMFLVLGQLIVIAVVPLFMAALIHKLHHAIAAAEAASIAKSQFLANMSHELRTPLNAILGFSRLMQQGQEVPPELRENLDIINRSGEHLLELINAVLEIAKIESGKLQLEVAPFDLGAMVREVVELMRLRAQEKGLTLVLDQSSQFPRHIKGDEARLRQILVNLVGNAVKFTDRGGVTIRLGVENNAHQYLTIEVEDTGPGIASEDQPRLFEPFVQLGEELPGSGTGLGLSITRQFVQLMGGRIAVTSTPGQGACFKAQLP
ncbi:MAG TPA: hybrid sensor histidine kinase/response regulator, partial [Zetaproteobacteria bacterium]|nr:hybrid sensor histidine kinase/response regulator [Zetaproteobacteria bacterium]